MKGWLVKRSTWTKWACRPLATPRVSKRWPCFRNRSKTVSHKRVVDELLGLGLTLLRNPEGRAPARSAKQTQYLPLPLVDRLRSIVLGRGPAMQIKPLGDRPPSQGGDRHHDLLQLYNKICDLDKGIVRRQFEIYVSLYDHIGDTSAEQYLKKWGNEGLYIRNRLAAVEAVGRSAESFAQQHEEMHPWVMAEVAHALVNILEAKAQFDHGLRTIYHRLDDAIKHIFLQDSYEAVIQAEPADGRSSVIQMMQSLVREKGGWINTARSLDAS